MNSQTRLSVVVVLAVIASFVGVAFTSPALADPGDCVLTGGGTFPDGSLVTVSAKTVDGVTSGQLRLDTATGRYEASVTFLSCRRDGGGGPGPGAPDGFANIAELEGAGTWNGISGFPFGATLMDHGEGNCTQARVRLPDEGTVVVADAELNVVAQAGGAISDCGGVAPLSGQGGNFQVRPSHP